MNADPFEQRRAGVLLHPTSLPGQWGNGDFGSEAYRFVDFLAAAGQSIWQMLPLGQTHYDGSPYQCLSVHAGNSQLISIDALLNLGWLSADDATRVFADSNRDVIQARYQLLSLACQGFYREAGQHEKLELEEFIIENRYWLEDFALYQAIRKENGGRNWSQWPVLLRDRDSAALAGAKDRLKEFIAQIYFEQFVFFRQWSALKSYANRHGILLFGDMPIFVAYDSVDVWAFRHYFNLDNQGRPLVVSGVPPDYFSETGQRWGNPHYMWDVMENDGFQWWIGRISTHLKLFDLIRIDHFRGFESYWEIPAENETAISGRWVKAPGDELFAALQQHFGSLPLVAEDLGIITPEVDVLREKYSLPGMKILQFAFDGSNSNPYLPHNHEKNSVVFTGTHDNNTTLGWFNSLSPECRQYVLDYLGTTKDPMPWPLVRAAYQSVARLAIIPMQDILLLGGEHRMNIPGTTEGNWQWRFDWSQLRDSAIEKLRLFVNLYGRQVL